MTMYPQSAAEEAELYERDRTMTTVQDALEQVNRGRIGSLVTGRGQTFTAANIPYLKALRQELLKWEEKVREELARVER